MPDYPGYYNVDRLKSVLGRVLAAVEPSPVLIIIDHDYFDEWPDMACFQALRAIDTTVIWVVGTRNGHFDDAPVGMQCTADFVLGCDDQWLTRFKQRNAPSGYLRRRFEMGDVELGRDDEDGEPITAPAVEWERRGAHTSSRARARGSYEKGK